METTLIAATVLAFASAILFFLVGRTVSKRAVSDDTRPANRAFALWWYGLGFLTLVGGVVNLVGDRISVQAYLGVTFVNLAILCAALWGLVFYLLALYSGSNAARIPLAVFYVAVFGFLVYLILHGKPDAVESTGWAYRLHPTVEPGDVLTWTAFALVLVPELLSAVGYLSLYWKVDDPAQKKRILLVGLSIFLWFGTASAGTSAGPDPPDWWQLTSKLIALAAAGVIYYAYAGLKPRVATPVAIPQEGPGLREDRPQPPRRMAIAG